MNVKQILSVCAEMLASESRTNPGKTLVVDGHPETFKEAYEELVRLISWLYPGLDTVEIRKVVLCKDCRYFKRYKKKSCFKLVYKCICGITQSQVDPCHFCGNAQEKRFD